MTETNQTALSTNETTTPSSVEEKDAKELAQLTTFGEGVLFQNAFSEIQKWQNNYNSSDQIPHYEVPLSFDLRNVSGIDFTSKVRDQGGCGSCYTFSFIQVIESRLKQKYGKPVAPLSVQQLLSCNYMTEGCDGGWAIMHGFLAENAGISSEECASY